jgi:hypothetical protein
LEKEDISKMPKKRKEKTLIFMGAKKNGKLKVRLDVNEVLVKYALPRTNCNEKYLFLKLIV